MVKAWIKGLWQRWRRNTTTPDSCGTLSSSGRTLSLLDISQAQRLLRELDESIRRTRCTPQSTGGPVPSQMPNSSCDQRNSVNAITRAWLDEMERTAYDMRHSRVTSPFPWPIPEQQPELIIDPNCPPNTVFFMNNHFIANPREPGLCPAQRKKQILKMMQEWK